MSLRKVTEDLWKWVGRVGLSRGGQTLIGITACGWFFRRIAGRWIRGGTAFEALNGIYTAPRTTCDLVS
jgi:hypothetical protein